MSAITPFRALFFFGADNVDEVNTEYQKMQDALEEGDGRYYIPDYTDEVKVIAVEYMIGHGDYVWFIREGQVMRRESWVVREIPVG